jgi:hypothetical protein
VTVAAVAVAQPAPPGKDLPKVDKPDIYCQPLWIPDRIFPMRKISPEAISLEIDTSDAPHAWNVYTINKDGDLLDLFDEMHDSDTAHDFAENMSKSTGLPLRIRRDL